MDGIAKFQDEHLQRISAVLADSATGLTGSEIGTYLLRLEIADPGTGVTKSVRLFEALNTRQNRDKCGDIVAAFIAATMDPVRYAGTAPLLELRRRELDRVLAACGFKLAANGKLVDGLGAGALTEPERKAVQLKGELKRRGLHPDVIGLARAELLAEGNAALVGALHQGLARRLRELTGLGDPHAGGAELVETIFGDGAGRAPRLAFNDLGSAKEQREHAALVHMLLALMDDGAGVDGGAPGPAWSVSDEDLLDLLTLASLLHRRLAGARRVRPPAREPGRTGREAGGGELGH